MLPETETNQVRTWFLKDIAPNGQYIAPMYKQNYPGFYANLLNKYYRGNRYEIFNYHIEVKPGKKSESKQDSLESKLLRMLLSRILQ